MIRRVLIASMFLFAAAAPAAIRSSAALSCTGPCPHIHTDFECNGNSECFWDNDDQRCESRFCSTGPCGDYRFTSACNADSRCFWDTDDQRCESRQ
jgi:hypothetical protein